MKIVVKHHLDTFTGAVVGTEFIETDPTKHPLPTHPLTGVGKVSWLDWLKHMDENPQSREVGGWHEETYVDGETTPKSRWQRVCEACNHPSAPADHQALKLGKPKGVK